MGHPLLTVPPRAEPTDLLNGATPKPADRTPFVLIVLLIAYSLFLSHYFAPAIQHPDANGYFAQGSLIATTGHSTFLPQSDAQYIGMHWLVMDNGRYVSRYPPGLAMIVAALWKCFGWRSAMLISPAMALIALVGAYVAVRRLISPGWALAAVVALALNPAFAEYALTDIAHVPVTCCLVWGVALLLEWSARRRWWLAMLAGAVLGLIPTFRYPDGIVALGIGLFLLAHARTIPHIWKHWLAAILGALVPIVPLLIRNQLVFGAFWKTGYALTNEQTGFSWAYFREHWMGYLQLLQDQGLGLMFGLGLIGMAWMICLRRTRVIGMTLALTSTPLLLVYMAYYWAPGMNAAVGLPGIGGFGGAGRGARMGGAGGGEMRFLVPLVPVYAIASIWALAEMLRHAPRPARIAVPIVLLGAQLLAFGPETTSILDRQHEQKQLMALATIGLESTAHAGDVVLAESGLLQQLDFVREWKLADPSIVRATGFGAGGRWRNARDPDAPSPMQAAKRDARAQLYTGTQSAKEEHFRKDVKSWADGHDVWIVASASVIDHVLPGVSKSEVQEVKRIPTPKVEPQQPTNGFFGGPGGAAGRGTRGFGAGAGLFGPGLIPGEEIVIARVKLP